MFRVMVDSPLGPSLKLILGRIENAVQRRPPEFGSFLPQLVAVSKTKPVESIVEAYKCGQRHFGENYVQEIVQKGSNPEISNLQDIKWHFIGHLQRNKCNNLTAVPNLHMVQTVDTPKLATALSNSWEKQNKPNRLKVMIQVNTSGEENKSGCPPGNSVELVSHIIDKCPGLEFSGIMTIGALARSVQHAPGERNEDFELLLACRRDICERLGLDVENVQLSMGMSSDYEHAIEMGSTHVRIGSSIFGARNKPSKEGGK
ncbi:pyridoxal phosphate homeostasis protein-like [Dendronephthya gigantea]|uniref:pyridoxal phosphate homeostasis protein-like n=1 Tax=Dendronephthya gigantea TaxID=151771 RepID=UPI00106A4C04|nr:pyridoxal phosphate homeostasis protein-like [Dendronephthya gigantea]